MGEQKIKKTIMIVEDEEHFHVLYKVMLEDTDYRIISAYDKDEAIKKLEEEKPDLLILDMHLNVVAGDSFFMYVKNIEKYAHVPIIIISAHSEKHCKILKEIDPNLVFMEKSYLTKERLIDEVEKKTKC